MIDRGNINFQPKEFSISSQGPKDFGTSRVQKCIVSTPFKRFHLCKYLHLIVIQKKITSYQLIILFREQPPL